MWLAQCGGEVGGKSQLTLHLRLIRCLLLCSLEWIFIHKWRRYFGVVLLQNCSVTTSLRLWYKPPVLKELILILPLDFLSRVCFMWQNLLSPDRQSKIESSLTADTAKLVFIWFLLLTLMFCLGWWKSRSFLIPWQLCKWDQIILTQF